MPGARPGPTPDGAVNSNGLAQLAGGWSEDDARGFERMITSFAVLDEELWK